MIKRPQNVQQMNHLKIFHKKISKQLKLQEQIRNGYEKQINKLEQRKQYLTKIIDNSLAIQDREQLNMKNKSLINFDIIEQDKSIIKPNKSILMKNQSNISQKNEKKYQQRLKLKQDYEKNTNLYKYKDLVQELQAMSRIYKNKKVKVDSSNKTKNINQIRANEIRDISKRNKFLEQKKKDQFMSKHLQSLQVIQTISPSDQVTTNLIKNLQKQERKMLQTIYQHKNILMRQTVKKRIQQKIDIILKQLYRKQKQQKRNVEQNTNRNKDIVKFGYTEQMLKIIEKNKMQRNEQDFNIE